MAPMVTVDHDYLINGILGLEFLADTLRSACRGHARACRGGRPSTVYGRAGFRAPVTTLALG